MKTMIDSIHRIIDKLSNEWGALRLAKLARVKLKTLSKPTDLYFKYKPLDMLESDFNIWKKNIINNTNDTLIREIYWKLGVISCILVLRNKFWFNQVLPIINNFWETLSREKIEGYQHRAPKKRMIKKQNTCLIDNSLFT